MDAEKLAVQIECPGEVGMIGYVRIPTRAEPSITAIRDFRRDWRRWSGVERVCATLLGGLWIVGVTTAILADAHLL